MRGDVTRSGTSRETERFARRFLLALLIAIALFAQGVIAAHSGGPQSRFADGDAVTSLLDIPCKSSSGADGSGAPSGKASVCCILCGAAAYAKAPLSPERDISSRALFVHLAPINVSVSLSCKRPSGWGSVWSAQAPPVVS
jgi:hypothetical protein